MGLEVIASHRRRGRPNHPVGRWAKERGLLAELGDSGNVYLPVADFGDKENFARVSLLLRVRRKRGIPFEG